MIHPLPQNTADNPLAARSCEELLRDWTGTVNSHALFDVACELYVNEEFEHAEVLFRYLLAFRTRAVAVWSWLGACLEAQGNRDTALLVYEAALASFAEVAREEASSACAHNSCTPEQRDEFAARIRVLRFNPRARLNLGEGGL
jgi:tetratricopeptide (TPR) repeat protein